PYEYDQKVIRIDAYWTEPERIKGLSAVVEEQGEDEDMNRRTFALLVAQSAERTEAARQKRLERRKASPSSAAEKKESKKNKPMELLQYLRSRIKDGLESVYQPPVTMKHLTQMKEL